MTGFRLLSEGCERRLADETSRRKKKKIKKRRWWWRVASKEEEEERRGEGKRAAKRRRRLGQKSKEKEGQAAIEDPLQGPESPMCVEKTKTRGKKERRPV